MSLVFGEAVSVYLSVREHVGRGRLGSCCLLDEATHCSLFPKLTPSQCFIHHHGGKNVLSMFCILVCSEETWWGEVPNISEKKKPFQRSSVGAKLELVKEESPSAVIGSFTE